MTLELVTIPCLSDNYAFLLHDPAGGETALIDAPEAAPILDELRRRGWRLDWIWLTHHHADHIQAVPELVAATGARVAGGAADAHRLPPLDLALRPGDTLTIGAQTGAVIDVPGHTLGHLAFHFAGAGLAFTADSLMAMGCGRLFEGTPEVMWESLTRLAALPAETVICSGHEYTAANVRFALTIDPDNRALLTRAARIAAARAEGRPTVPTLLADELATNPFLRARAPRVKAHLGMEDATDAAAFAEIRRRKDNF